MMITGYQKKMSLNLVDLYLSRKHEDKFKKWSDNMHCILNKNQLLEE